MRVLHRAIQHGLIQACHDCSEGGIGVAVAEMCLAGRRGAELDLSVVPGAAAMVRDDALLFSESICRFVVEVRPADRETFEKLITGIPHAVIGHVLDENDLHIRGRRVTDRIPVADLENAWRGQPAAVPPATIPPLPPAARPRPVRTLPKRIGLPQVIILHANGSNRDHDAALACEVAGGQAEIVHINQITQGEKHLLDYHMLVIPGGFSYGDDLGAGTLWALNLQYRLGDEMRRFVESGRPVFGICNGFQVLVKAGLLPGPEFVSTSERPVTLAPNESDQFECRWVYLKPNPASPSLFTAGLNELIYCPVAHGEGRLAARDETVLNAVWNAGLAALTYVQADGSPTSYPGNPNGSAWGIAGLCNPAGNVLGMMPHPENHIFPWQHPRWHRGESGFIGLRLFENGLRSA
jgi:phosphoribosylformylglycinamidine synthase I